ncbi:MAG: hypothetical protein M3081_08995 [Gemmatimonadota bacterium]|nr:hypothetical protein [Gemmatimonadota bacterium]
MLRLAVVVASASFAPLAISAQAGAGAKFGGARDPKTCADRTAPKRGAITAALAAQYVTCEEEHISSGSLYLVDDMKVQVGAGRPFQLRSDSYNEIDPSQPVYAIRGSYVRYACSVPNATLGNFGKNCALYDQPHASGVCFKTTFGDWRCSMKDLDNTITRIKKEIPPPR